MGPIRPAVGCGVRGTDKTSGHHTVWAGMVLWFEYALQEYVIETSSATMLKSGNFKKRL